MKRNQSGFTLIEIAIVLVIIGLLLGGYRLDRDHKLHKLVTAKDGLIHPESICYRDGALYITDDEAGKLYCYTPRDGLRTVAVFAGRLKYVQGITVGSSGSLLITVQDLKHKQGLILKIGHTAEHKQR